MKSSYEIRHLRNTNNTDLVKALELYSHNIEPALRTATKEIMYWVDRYNKRFEDSFFLLGLYLNDVLIGFSELAYFLQEKTVIVDYVIIDKPFRKLGAFYQFVHEIEEFLQESGIIFDYVVAEIGYYNEKLEPPAKSKNMIRLLKMAGFCVAKCTYYTPRLGIYNHESEMKSVLMIYTLDETKKIKKETFLQIVNAIYFKYNQRWYDAFLNEEQKIEYQKGLNKLLSKIENGIAKKEFIEMNGYGHLFHAESKNRKTILGYNKLLKIITGIFTFVLCFILVTGIYLFLKLKYGIDSSALSTIFYTSLFLVAFLFAVLFEKKSNTFLKIIEKILKKE